MEPTYLGDGVYISGRPFYDLEIYTFNGESKTNIIYLDAEIEKNLLKFLMSREKR